MMDVPPKLPENQFSFEKDSLCCFCLVCTFELEVSCSESQNIQLKQFGASWIPCTPCRYQAQFLSGSVSAAFVMPNHDIQSFLQMIKHDHVCLSCWIPRLEKFLEQTLGCFGNLNGGDLENINQPLRTSN